MHLPHLLALAALTGTALSKSRTCHGQRLYCGSSLANMGTSPPSPFLPPSPCPTHLAPTPPTPTTLDTDTLPPGWSTDAIWAGLQKGQQDYPNWLTDKLFATTLFECDGRRGGDALWYRSACVEGGCHDAGAGRSDYCQ